MNYNNNAKRDLYNFVDDLRHNLGITLDDAPVNALKICRSLGDIEILCHLFDTNGFCGAAFAGKLKNTIILNSARSSIEQNFDCGHELIHLAKHRNINGGVFNCFEKDRSSFLEWEANEGSAQFIIPYQDFIPRFISYLTRFRYSSGEIPEMLAHYYNVSTQVINIRLDSLSYEIDQYRVGVPLNGLELLSRRQRQKQGISSTRYDAICAFGLS